LVEGVLDEVPVAETPTPLIADRAYDSDKLRTNLLAKGWDLVCPHRKGRVRPNTQDGRKLRRYRRRWKIERTISWIGGFRRLMIRHEYYSFIYQGFIHLACILICLRRF
jgi:transposase